MPRLRLQTPMPLTRNNFGHAEFPTSLGEPNAKRLSYHTDVTDSRGGLFKNLRTNRGPMEGRPLGEIQHVGA
jgi:manganese oxidase